MTTRILTVEDDERIRTALRLALEDEGWEVDEVSSGEDALVAFGRVPADVVLVDIMLPGIDGFDICRAIRKSSDVPIVMITARSDTHDVVAGLEAGGRRLPDQALRAQGVVRSHQGPAAQGAGVGRRCGRDRVQRP